MRTFLAVIILTMTTSLFIGCDKNDGNNAYIPPTVVNPYVHEQCRIYTGQQYTDCVNRFNHQPQGNYLWSSNNIIVTNPDQYEDMLFHYGMCDDSFLSKCDWFDEHLRVMLTVESLTPNTYGTAQIYALVNNFSQNVSINGNLNRPMLYQAKAFTPANNGTAVSFDYGSTRILIESPNFVETALNVVVKFAGIEVARGSVQYCSYGVNCLY